MKILIFHIISLFICSFAFHSDFSFHVLNDLHLNPLYDPNIPSKLYCSTDPSSTSMSDLVTPVNNFTNYANIGCDPPLKFLKIFLKKLKSQYKPPDFILLPGDLVTHGLSQTYIPNGNYSKLKYELLKKVIKLTSEYITYNFPNSYIFPSLGNNDVKFHYMVPNPSEKLAYYSYIYQVWFKENTKNQKLKNIDEIQADFLDGGYYKADITHNFSVIVLNTLYYLTGSYDVDKKTPDRQLAWLEKKLEEIKRVGGKTIITYHIFPGLNYYSGIQHFLNETATKEFKRLFYVYNDFILLNVAAHTHNNGFRVNHQIREGFLNLNKEELFGNTIVSGSISPAFDNNPSYLHVDFEDYKAKQAKFTFFNLNNILKISNRSNFTDEEINEYFSDYDINKEFGLVDITRKSFWDLSQKLFIDDNLLKKFLFLTVGYPYDEKQNDVVFWLYQKADKLFQNTTTWQFNQTEKRRYVCTLIELEDEGFNKCLKK